MAVEATHLSLFPREFIQESSFSRDSMMNSGFQENGRSDYWTQMIPSAATTILPTGNYSVYNQTIVSDDQAKNTDLACNNYVPVVTRKRSRKYMNQLYTIPLQKNIINNHLSQIHHHQQLDMETIISHYSKKTRLELEKRQKQHARLLAAAIGEDVMKKLHEKDEQIQRMGKLNLVLQERVNSLFIENQVWRDLAQSNEATANTLRTNLEQVLAHVDDEEHIAKDEDDGDVASCCGSNADVDAREVPGAGSFSDMMCKSCGERESCVLLLPCRHLCLCGVCGGGSQTIQACPICNSIMNATLHVNMTS